MLNYLSKDDFLCAVPTSLEEPRKDFVLMQNKQYPLLEMAHCPNSLTLECKMQLLILPYGIK